MQMSFNRLNNKGFTLIELLVVIAIIAILAAILFPVFAQVREKARQTTCASNEKQLGLAVMQYTQDYDESYPDGYMGYGNGGNVSYGQGWAGQIYPYVKAIAAFQCPDDVTTGTQTSLDINPSTSGFFANTADTKPVSYAYNRSLIIPQTSGNSHSAYTIAKLVASASTILLYECQGQQADVANQIGLDGSSPGGNGVYPAGNNAPKYVAGIWSGTSSGIANFNLTAVHTSGGNYLFTDGHVKYLLPGTVSAGWGNQNATGCGAYPGDYATGTTTIDGSSFTGGQAASVNQLGSACSGITPYATFSPT
jgi:prepilin-type N-terminal cleavage/methylation domain-containing protein/prepilin-type processing-associated H-X9-DG protein